MQPTVLHTIEEIKKLYPDVYVNEDGGSDTYQEGLPIVERDPLTVVIKHPSQNSYLIAKWKKSEWNGFLTGGIEGEDSVEDTVRKEILEETGYKHVSKIVPMDYVTHGVFFHPVKNVNRLAHYHLVFAELTDLEKDDVSEEETNIADFVWIPYDDVLETLTREEMKLLWKHYSETLNPKL